MAFRALAPKPKRGERRTARGGALLREQADLVALVPRLARMAAETGPKVGSDGVPKADKDGAKARDTPYARPPSAAASGPAPMTEQQKAARDRRARAERLESAEAARNDITKKLDVDAVEGKSDDQVYNDLYVQHGNISQVRSAVEAKVDDLKRKVKKGTAPGATPDEVDASQSAQQEMQAMDLSRFKKRKQKVMQWVRDPDTDEFYERGVVKWKQELVAYADINDVELIVPLNCWKARGLEPTPMWAQPSTDAGAGVEAWRGGLDEAQAAVVDRVLTRAEEVRPKRLRDAQAVVPMYFKARKKWEASTGTYVDLGINAGLRGVEFQCQRAPTQEGLRQLLDTYRTLTREEHEEKGIPEGWSDLSEASQIAWVLRSHLYQYTVDSNDELTGGSVTLTSDALLGQKRGYGPRRPFEGGPFMQRCKYPKGMQYGDDGFVKEEWRAAYNRANKYRMEVARLWWKLYHFQSEDTQMVTEKLGGVFAVRADGQSFDHYMVLAITELGHDGFLQTGTISPEHQYTELTEDVDARSEVEFELSDTGMNQLVSNCYPPNSQQTVRADHDRTWPIARIDHSLAWASFSSGAQIMGNNSQFYNIMRYFFGPLAEDDPDAEPDKKQRWVESKGFIQNSFDWDRNAWDDFLKPIAPQVEGGEEPTWEKDGPGTLDVIELAFDNLINAMPLWAHMFLSTDLVDDTESEEQDATAVDGANDMLREVYEALRAVPADSTAASQLRCLDTQLRAEFQDRGAYRDAASIVYHSYPSDSDADRDLIDRRGANRDRAGLVDPLIKAEIPWAQEHLMRAVNRVEQPGDEMDDKNYAMDRAIVVPAFGYMAAQAYRQWWVEKYMGLPFGPDWTVALQNMHVFEMSETPWYVQAQGLYGVVRAVEEIKDAKDPLQRHLYEVVVLRDEFRLHLPDDQVEDNGEAEAGESMDVDRGAGGTSTEERKPTTREAAAAAGRTTADGELIVKVKGAHIWPRWTATVASEDLGNPDHKTPIRYGDKVRVATQAHDYIEKGLREQKKDEETIIRRMMPYRIDVEYAAIGSTWLAPLSVLEALEPSYGTFSINKRNCFALTSDKHDAAVTARLKKVGNLQLVPWLATRETDFSYLKYRNNKMELVTERGNLDMAHLRAEVTRYIPEPGGTNRNDATKLYVDKISEAIFVAVPFQDIDEHDETSAD